MATETKRPWEQKLEDAGVRAEEEVRRVVTYINDQAMPEARRNSSLALRTTAVQLEKLARRMETRWPPTPETEGDRGDARP